MKLFEFKAAYKAGHTRYIVRTSIIAQNITTIEETPMELPEYTEGYISRIEIVGGRFVFSNEDYTDLISRWEEALKESVL